MSICCYGQQDAQQSQYLFNGIYINPAYAGYKEILNVNAFYRSQWTGIDGAPTTVSLAIDATANNGNVGLAFQVANDNIGAQNDLSAYINYAYRLRLSENEDERLALGLGVGLRQLGINGSLLKTNDPEFDQPTGNQSFIVPDGRLGIYYTGSSFFAGLSADNLIAQYADFNNHTYIAQPKPHYYFSMGMLIPIAEDVSLKTSMLLRDDRAGPTSLDINNYILFGEKLWVGASYRTGIKLYNKPNLQSNLTQSNAVIATAQIFVSKTFRLGYAYDFSIGALSGYSGASHELSVSIYFKNTKTRMLSPRYF
jgi:type IX secretion system PorP/SprF family membrane protein